MYSFEIREELQKAQKKLKKKNKPLFEQLDKKIKQIIQNPFLGKPLKNVMSGIRRVHVCGCFVLFFEVNDAKENIVFLYLEDHDHAYR